MMKKPSVLLIISLILDQQLVAMAETLLRKVVIKRFCNLANRLPLGSWLVKKRCQFLLNVELQMVDAYPSEMPVCIIFWAWM